MINKYYVILLFFAALLFIGCKAFMSLIIYTSFSKINTKNTKEKQAFGADILSFPHKDILKIAIPSLKEE